MTALLPALLCGGGMLVCFLMMGRMHGKDHGQATSNDAASNCEVAALRDELDRLRAEVRENAAGDAAPADGLDGRPAQLSEAALERQEQRLPRP